MSATGARAHSYGVGFTCCSLYGIHLFISVYPDVLSFGMYRSNVWPPVNSAGTVLFRSSVELEYLVRGWILLELA